MVVDVVVVQPGGSAMGDVIEQAVPVVVVVVPVDVVPVPVVVVLVVPVVPVPAVWVVVTVVVTGIVVVTVVTVPEMVRVRVTVRVSVLVVVVVFFLQRDFGFLWHFGAGLAFAWAPETSTIATGARTIAAPASHATRIRIAGTIHITARRSSHKVRRNTHPRRR